MRETPGHPKCLLNPDPARITLTVLLAALLPALLAACGNDDPQIQQVPGGDAARGKQLLAQFQCGACHSIPGVEAARSTAGPPLDRFGRASYVAGRFPNYPEPLVRWIVDPPAMKPGTPMPALGVSEQDARHMAAYLYTLR